MRGELLTPESPRWIEAAESLGGDIYHLPEFARLLARVKGGRAAAFLADSEAGSLLVPLILQPVPERAGGGALLDASSPYGYGGPLASWGERGPWDRAIAVMNDVLTGSGVVSLFLRAHPLLTRGRASWAGAGTVLGHGRTVAIDLGLDDEALWSDTRSGHRSEINRLEKDGFTCVIDDWSVYPEFQRTYHATMRRVGADARYFFPSEYYEGLAALRPRVHLLTVRSPEGEYAAGALFFRTGGILQYHLSGTVAAFRKRAPIKLLLHQVRSWGRGTGARVLHLGGGVAGEEDSLFRFKHGFGGSLHRFWTARLIPDEERYVAACRRAQVDNGRAGFFPPYRRSDWAHGPPHQTFDRHGR